MGSYESKVLKELSTWQKEMIKSAGFTNNFTKGIQKKLNSIIPEKANIIITSSIKNMVKGVIFTCKYVSKSPLHSLNLKNRENLVKEKIKSYRKAAMLSGAGTGAGGILLSLADFPILLSLKIKFLFDIAGIYGFNLTNYKERLYILYIFQIAFSSQKRRNEIYHIMSHWRDHSKSLPIDMDNFDWKTFQQEYRDYIDIAKMLQMLPGIGAVVGAYANYKLMDKLGNTAMNAYRLRLLDNIKN